MTGQKRSGQDALILIDTAHFPENFDLANALGKLTANAPPANLAGDFNSDGAVDAADYVVWRKGVVVPHTAENHTLWRANFGNSAGVGAAAIASVPEPATWLLAVVAVLAAAARSIYSHRQH